MGTANEIEKIVAFVRDQRRHAATRRQWKRRLAGFGFTIAQTADGPVIATLPRRRPVCPLPPELLA